MDNKNRSLVVCGLIAAFCLGACITTSDELDLNKDISLDMQIGPGGLSIPLGSLDTLYLDSLIKLDGDNSILDTLDGGLFGFRMKDSLSVDLEKIQPVTIKIDPPAIDPIEAQFRNPEVGDVDLPVNITSSTITISKTDVSGINSKLPSFSNPINVGPFTVLGINGDIEEIPVVASPEPMDCNFNYTLPSDLKKLNKVWFGNTKYSRTGQKLLLDVNLSGVYNVLSSPSIRVKNLTITFPSNFVVEKDPGLATYIPDNCVSANNNVFSIHMESGAVTGIGSDHKLPITFYLKYADFSAYDNAIDFSGQVVYELELGVGGKAGSTTKQFQVSVDLNTALQMADIDAETRSKEVDIEKDTIKNNCTVDDLDGITRVNTITFDSNLSRLYLSLSDIDIDPFAFKQDGSCSLILRFPADFEFDTDWVKDENGLTVGSWDGSRLNLDISKTMGHTVSLKVKSLDVNKNVDKETASIQLSNNIIYSGVVVVAENDHITLASLDALGDKTFEFRFWGKFVIENSQIVTDEMKTDFKDSTRIDINQKVDDALIMIQRIDLIEPAKASIDIQFSGIPNTINRLDFSHFTVEFPEFILLGYTGNDNRIKVKDNLLVINGALTDELHTQEGFSVDGLQIAGMVFDEPLETVDGNLVLEGQMVRINGSVVGNEQVVNDNELDVITVTPSVTIDSIRVKSVYGKFNPKIDPVNEGIDLDLGDVDFLKNKDNYLSLSDPQIKINLNSTITVPIDIDLKLITLDSHGDTLAKIAPDPVGGDRIIHLEACETDAPSRNTQLVIFKNGNPVSDNPNVKYVRISELSSLMSPVPDKIVFNLKASANQSVDHFIDLTRELAVSGDYEVSIPLSFDSLYLAYSDTIKDLSEDMENIADKIDAAELLLMADVESTIPLGVNLSAKAYDKNMNEVPGIKIFDTYIKAGSDSVSKSSISIGLDVEKGALEKLDAIVFTAAAQSGDSGTGIRKGQWLLLKKLRIKFPQGLKVDLTDMNKDDDK